MNVDELLKRQEGKTLEFKRELTTAERVLVSVVAFANTAGGIVLFGVEDQTRRVIGIPDPHGLEERLANLLSEAIRPRLAPEIEVLPWRKTHVVAVRVFPSPGRPHYVKAKGPEEGVYIRVGPSNRRVDRIMLDELRRLAHRESFDEQPMLEQSSEALDFRAASEFFSPVRLMADRDWRTLGIVVEHQGHLRPSTGGMLLFGHERARWFPDAYIQAGRFHGTDRTDILETVEIHSYLPQAAEEGLAYIRKHESQGLDIREARHTERLSIPFVAIREAVINAVVHADYAQRGAPIRLSLFDDRLEVENPGLLPFGLTVEDVLQGVSKLRNRVIGRVFKEVGLIEQWGSGIGRMLAACREAGLPDPHFEEVGWHFRVTLFKGRTVTPTTDAVDETILHLLRVGKGYTTAEIAQVIQRTSRATRTRLANLVARGIVVEVGSGPRDPYRKYYLVSP
jgi:predicted HTH transcriptional regulator